MELYGYWRSSASYRARIALNFKRLDYQYLPVHLLRDGGQQHQQAYRQLNPNGLVPTLVDGKTVIHQSLAIMEYLDEKYPGPALLPGKAADRAQIRAMSLDLASELQPLINLRVQQYLSGTLKLDDQAKKAWLAHWFAKAFASFEISLIDHGGNYCYGDLFSMADACLVPQVYSAERFGIDLTAYPRLQAMYQKLLELPWVAAAHPSKQPDAES
ncbi:maleylacetoacetate isomerase [Pseudidiomarina mangrovi]|uniref:maleylacetoacetate isomerase n=1 Tax=Pseudidiomarina mangrovi TaxID=2487133 RepID=UPI000FCCCA0D|nr:maleylacetoacetate isomerase [Pseudidiomarina mangrovi]